MSSFFKSSDSFVGAVFGIGSSSVGGALVRFETGKAPSVIYTIREHIPRESADQGLAFGKMVETLRRADGRLMKEGKAHLAGAKVKQVFCIFSIPWCESRARMVSIDASEKPFVVTESYVARVLEKEEGLFAKELEKSPRTKLKNDEYVSVGKDVIQIKVNGYSVKNPYGKEARALDIAFFISLLPEKVAAKVEETLLRAHHLREIRSFAFPLAALTVIRDTFPQVGDFIFIDIAGEFTDISVAKDGVVVENSGFPLGRNFLVKRVMERLGEPFDVSVSLLQAYFDGHIDAPLEKKISAVLDESKKEWQTYLETALKDISKRVLLPRSVFVIVGDFVPFFIRTVKELSVGLFNTNGPSFEARLLNYDSIRAHVSFEKTAEIDYFLALESVFVAKTLEK